MMRWESRMNDYKRFIALLIFAALPRMQNPYNGPARLAQNGDSTQFDT